MCIFYKMASLKYCIILLLANVVFGSRTSSGDQYKSLDSNNNLMQTINDVTVKPHRRFQARHRFYSLSSKNKKVAERELEVPELQVGCGEGFTDFKEEQQRKKLLRRKRSTNKTRKRRDYYNWPRPVVPVVPQLQSISVWQPPVYQISRPYFIPVWGAPGRIPIYFPPQPLLTNPGYPIDNPRASSLPPIRYLPPDNHQPKTPDGDIMDLENRFNYSDDDDRPVWDLEVPISTQRPQKIPTTTIKPVTPTRKRRPSGRTTTPPSLVHASNNAKNLTGVMSLSTSNQEISFESQPSRPKPQFASKPQASPRPQNGQQSKQGVEQNGPSRCVWAIISCCSVTSAEISDSCFEQLGCPGAFWDSNPCDSEFARAAIDSALNYYENK